MRRLGFIAVGLVLALAACGDDGPSVELAPGGTFSGAFTAVDGVGPGEVSFTLNDTGSGIVVARLDPGFSGLQCPNGGVIESGGFQVEYGPRLPISGESFSDAGWSGTFSSPTEVSGTYELSEDYDCDVTLEWSATAP
jgi:hypothetical protein